MTIHHKWIIYLGPPTISPSSPTAGAAGARLLGSVPGAALKVAKDGKQLLDLFRYAIWLWKLNAQNVVKWRMSCWGDGNVWKLFSIEKEEEEEKSLRTKRFWRSIWDLVVNFQTQFPTPRPQMIWKNFFTLADDENLISSHSGWMKSLQVIELLLFPAKFLSLHNPVEFFWWLNHRFSVRIPFWHSTEFSEVGEKFSEVCNKSFLRNWTMFHWRCPQNDKNQ